MLPTPLLVFYQLHDNTANAVFFALIYT